jgi:hypothetical protein
MRIIKTWELDTFETKVLQPTGGAGMANAYICAPWRMNIWVSWVCAAGVSTKVICIAQNAVLTRSGVIVHSNDVEGGAPRSRQHCPISFAGSRCTRMGKAAGKLFQRYRVNLIWRGLPHDIDQRDTETVATALAHRNIREQKINTGLAFKITQTMWRGH